MESSACISAPRLQFGSNPWGSWSWVVEASDNIPTDQNNTGNFTACANPAYSCGLLNINDLKTVGGRLGLAADRFLFTFPVVGRRLS